MSNRWRSVHICKNLNQTNLRREVPLSSAPSLPSSLFPPLLPPPVTLTPYPWNTSPILPLLPLSFLFALIYPWNNCLSFKGDEGGDSEDEVESEYAPSGSDEEEESSQEEYSSETETSEEGSGKAETLHSPWGGSVSVVLGE